MGVDLATILAIMGTVWTGDPLSLDPRFSIGGRDTGVNNLLNNLGGLLGTIHHTLSRAVNRYSNNASYRRAPGSHWVAQFYRS